MDLQASPNDDASCFNKQHQPYSNNNLPSFYNFRNEKRSGGDFDQSGGKPSVSKNRRLPIENNMFQGNNPDVKIPMFSANHKSYSNRDGKNLHDNVPVTESSNSIDSNYLSNSSFPSPKEKRHYTYPTSTHSSDITNQTPPLYSSFAPMTKYHTEKRNIIFSCGNQSSSDSNSAFVVEGMSEKFVQKSRINEIPCEKSPEYSESTGMKANLPLVGGQEFENFPSTSSTVSSLTPQKEKTEEMPPSLTRFPVSTILSDIKSKPYPSETWKTKSDDSSVAEDSSDQEFSTKSDLKSEKDCSAFKEEDELNAEESNLEEGN